jgi:ADP-heptose:LPS heptosyltransferase
MHKMFRRIIRRTASRTTTGSCLDWRQTALAIARHGTGTHTGGGNWARDFIAANALSARTCLGVHVGSGGTKNLALKRWPLDHYVRLIKQLTKSQPHLAVLLFGGPEEKEAHARIRAEVSSPNIFVPETQNLRQAGALIKYCQAFLSVDTALMHLAAAMKVPNQIVIEAPTLNATMSYETSSK